MPPVTPKSMAPVESPLQRMSVPIMVVASGAAGCKISAESTVTIPLESVTVTTYHPAAWLTISSAFIPPGDHK